MKKKLSVLILVTTMLALSVAQIGQAQEEQYFFTITITHEEYFASIVEYFKQDLEEIGIGVELEIMDYAAMIDVVTKNTKPKSEGGWDMHLSEYAPRVPIDLYLPFHSSNIWPEGIGNRMSYSSGTADRLIEEIALEIDSEIQRELVFQLQELMYDEQPLFHIFNQVGLQVYHPSVEGHEEYSKWCIPADDFLYPSIFTKIPGEETFVVAGAYSIPTFCPLLTYGYFGQTWTDGIVKLSPEGEIIPSLAKSWEFSEDGLTITFHLRNDETPIVWSDDVPFTSKDVKFTYESIMNPDLGALLYTQFTENIESIETPDDYTVILNLKQNYTPILFVLSRSTGPWLLPEHIFKDIPIEEWASHEYFTKTGFPSLGPYEVDEVDPGITWKFKTNEKWWGWDYWGIEPPYENLVFKYIDDTNVAIAATEKGELHEIDYYYNIVEFFPTIEDNPNLVYDIVDTPTCYAFYPNLNHPILNNKYVRKAINHALNRGGFIEEIQYDLPKPMSGMMSFYWSKYVNPDIDQDPYDVAKAKQYMEMAGFNYESLEPVTPPMNMFAIYAIAGLIVGALVTFVLTRLTK